MGLDGWIEWLCPEAFPASFQDRVCLYQRSTVNWPQGQRDGRKHEQDKPETPYNANQSYLERLVNLFPTDTFVGDGNFTFNKHYTRNLYNYHGFIVPFRKPKKKELSFQQKVFNENIQNIRTVVEHVFLLKNYFTRFNSRWDRPWYTLIHHFHICCGLHNMMVAGHNEGNLPVEMEDFFERAPIVESDSENEDQADDDQRYANFPIHAMRARIMATTRQRTQQQEVDTESSEEVDDNPPPSSRVWQNSPVPSPAGTPQSSQQSPIQSPTSPQSPVSPFSPASSPTAYNFFKDLSQGRRVMGKRKSAPKNYGVDYITY